MSRPYEDFERECARVTEVMTAAVVDAGIDKQADIELHALEHHFFRNKAAYIVGRISGKGLQIPFVMPMLHTESEASPGVFGCLLVGFRHYLQAVFIHTNLLHGGCIDTVPIRALFAAADAT